MAVVGEAFVAIRPELSGFAAEAAAGLGSTAQQLGATSGATFGQAFGAASTASVTGSTAALGAELASGFGAVGAASGAAFGESFGISTTSTMAATLPSLGAQIVEGFAGLGTIAGGSFGEAFTASSRLAITAGTTTLGTSLVPAASQAGVVAATSYAQGFIPTLQARVIPSATAIGGTTGTAFAGGFASKALPQIAAVLSLVQVAGFVGDSISEARDAAREARLLDQVLRTMGESSGVTADGVKALAERLSELAGVDDDLIVRGARLLLTFQGIRNEAGAANDVFDQTVEAALNMSAALGTDLEQNIIQLGKALAGGAEGAAALRRTGSLLPQDLDALNRMVEEGASLLDQQKFILAALEKQYGGAAAAGKDAFTVLGTTFDNLKEKLGEQLLPAVNELAEKLSDPEVVRAFELAMKGLGFVVIGTAEALGQVADAIATGASVVGDLVDEAERLARLVPFLDSFLDKWISRGGLGELDGAWEGVGQRAGEMKGAAAAIDDVGESAEEAADDLETMADAIGSILGAELSLADAQLGLEQSQRAVARAEQALADVRNGTAAELRAIEDAVRSLTDAQEDAQEVMQRLNELERTEGQRLAEMAIRTDLGRRDAADALSDAERDLVRAEEDLAALRDRTGPEALERIAAAEERLTKAREAADEANRALTTSANDQARAQAEFDAAVERGDVHAQARAFERLSLANQRAAEAQRRAAEAASNTAEAERARATADQADPRAIEDAEERVEDATRAVEHAHQGVRDAAKERAEVERQLREGTDELTAAQKESREATERVERAQRDVNEARADAVPTADDLRDAELDLESAQLAARGAALHLVDALTELDVKRREAKGEEVDANERLRIYRGHLQSVADTVKDGGSLDRALDDYVAKLGKVAGALKDVETAATDAAKAMGAEAFAGVGTTGTVGTTEGDRSIRIVPVIPLDDLAKVNPFKSFSGSVPVEFGASGATLANTDPVLSALERIIAAIRESDSISVSMVPFSGERLDTAREVVRGIRAERWVSAR